MIANKTISLAGRTVPYAVRYSRRARRLSLTLSPDAGLVIVMPRRFSNADVGIESFLREKSQWILRKLDHYQSLRRVVPKPLFADGSAFPFLGDEIVLRVERTEGKRATVRLAEKTLCMHTPEIDEERVREILIAWYRHAAQKIISERVHQLNAALAFPVKSVIVRDQKSRWGSCSRRGTLSFNWRLLIVPTAVMDYLIYHELAHLREMNHSIRFWRVVNALCPTFRESEHWLRRHGRMMFW